MTTRLTLRDDDMFKASRRVWLRQHTVSVAGCPVSSRRRGDRPRNVIGIDGFRDSGGEGRRRGSLPGTTPRLPRSVVGAAGPQAVEQDGDDDETADEGAPCQKALMPSRIRLFRMISMSAAPTTAPKAVPTPPIRFAPPIAAAAMTPRAPSPAEAHC
jgi:hypothetical protein